MTARRLLKEIEEFQNSSAEGISLINVEAVKENPLSEWHIAMEGYSGTLFDGKYTLCMVVPNEYPFKGPKFKFINDPIPTHPCIKLNGEFKGHADHKTGAISMVGMTENWSPKWSIHKLCLYLRWALAYFKHGKFPAQITMTRDFDPIKFSTIQNMVPFELELDLNLQDELFYMDQMVYVSEEKHYRLPIRSFYDLSLLNIDSMPLTFHGTDAKYIVSIIEQGFMPNHGAYGFGVYFSPRANIALSYSNGTINFNGQIYKVVIEARVEKSAYCEFSTDLNKNYPVQVVHDWTQIYPTAILLYPSS